MPTNRAAPLLALSLALLSACVSVTGARQYEVPQQSTWRPSDEAPLYDALRTQFRREGLQFVADPAIAEACRQIVQVMAHAPKHRIPSSTTRDLLLRRAGVLEHEYTFSEWEGPFVAVPEDLGDVVHRQISATHDVELIASGAARATADDGTGLLVVISAYRRVLFEAPPPRVAEVGDVVRLRGRTHPSLGELALYVTPPGAAVREEALGNGPGFATQIELNRKGIWQIELGSDGRFGPFELVNFPVYVGVSDDVPIRDSGEVPTDRAAVERDVLALVNEARAEHDLPALQPMRELVELARAHSEDMRDEHFFGHQSPRTGSPTDRVERSGLKVAAVAENVAQNLTAIDLHEGLMRSPGHRMNVLDPRMTHVGVGAADVPRGGPTESWLLTELFVRVNPRVDPVQARAEVLEHANAARGGRGVRALESDARLEAIAQAAAERFFRQRLSLEDALNGALAEVNAKEIPLRAVSAQALRASALDSAQHMDLLGRPEFDHVGLGVAQGTRSDGAPNELFVVAIAANEIAPLVAHDTAVGRLLAEINRARAQKGLRPVVLDSALQTRADALAARFFEGTSTDALFEQVRREGVRVPYKTLRYQAAEVLQPEDAAAWTVPLDAQMERVGLGFAQGSPAGDVQNAMYVFLLAIDAP